MLHHPVIYRSVNLLHRTAAYPSVSYALGYEIVWQKKRR